MVIKLHSPLKRVNKSSYPKWFSGELRILIHQKKAANARYKASMSDMDYANFSRLRRDCKLLADKCYRDYINQVKNSTSNNVNAFWSHVNSSRSAPSSPPKMFLDSDEASQPLDKCQLFARLFSSVFEEKHNPIPDLDFGLNLTLSNVEISAVDDHERLASLDPAKGTGPDEIPPAVLQQCAHQLSPHLAIYFRGLLAAGVFPSSLKFGYIMPIHKSGDKKDV